MKNRNCSALVALFFWVGLVSPLSADGPQDNIVANVRPIPPMGIILSPTVRQELAEKAVQIRSAVAAVKESTDANRAEVLVCARAIELALEQSMFYSDTEVQQARDLYDIATQRVHAIEEVDSNGLGERWVRDVLATRGTEQVPANHPTLIVGGFRSKIDESIQPYGLVIPNTLLLNDPRPRRLDIWLRGRGEKTGEVQFLHQRATQIGEISPDDTIVVHPFGRFCNANKFAGEIDVLEAIEHVKTLFPINDNRINIRGFSMGGAGCWQLAVHYPSMWLAATPGAGFCETREFLKGFQQELFVPAKYQLSLLHWYDCPDWGNNLRYLPTIAYSGELDKQKQAADLMERTLRDRGIALTHIIGPQTAHKLHPDFKIEVERQLAELSKSGRDSSPREIDFTTYTLRYHRSGWVDIQGLEKHWNEARVQATVDVNGAVAVTTKNVSKLTLGPIVELPHVKSKPRVVIDGQPWESSSSADLPVLESTFKKTAGKWSIESHEGESNAIRKRPGLQGPIDDAFMSPFLFVAPNPITQPSIVDRWVDSEFSRAKSQWRLHYRGDVNERSVESVSDEDKRSKNLILFGTPASNPLIAEMMKSLPIHWTKTTVGTEHPSQSAALIAIYPSPFATDRYVVLNSGFTFREYAYLNNARQIAMLPDWAIVDVTDGATTQLPGKILDAGFFDESWQVENDE